MTSKDSSGSLARFAGKRFLPARKKGMLYETLEGDVGHCTAVFFKTYCMNSQTFEATALMTTQQYVTIVFRIDSHMENMAALVFTNIHAPALKSTLRKGMNEKGMDESENPQ